MNIRVSNVISGTRNINKNNAEYSFKTTQRQKKTRRDIYLINLDSFVQYNQLANVFETRVLIPLVSARKFN